LEYRRTWKNFSSKLYEMQELTDSGQSGAAAAVLVSVRAARLEHNAARDRLAKYLAARKVIVAETAADKRISGAQNAEGQNEPQRNKQDRDKQDEEQRIRRTARLIWEFSGKPQNTAESDWRHAEELVRAASA
jgi:dihydroorotase-like cyclic amidohydrolase